MLDKIITLLPDLIPGWKQKGLTVITWIVGAVGAAGYLGAAQVDGLNQFFADNWFWIMPAITSLAEVFRRLAVNRVTGDVAKPAE